jgi:hypothetical protein
VGVLYACYGSVAMHPPSFGMINHPSTFIHPVGIILCNRLKYRNDAEISSRESPKGLRALAISANKNSAAQSGMRKAVSTLAQTKVRRSAIQGVASDSPSKRETYRFEAELRGLVPPEYASPSGQLPPLERSHHRTALPRQ